MPLDHRDGRTIRLFFQLDNKTLLYRWLSETWKRGFIFEGIRRWCFTNVATSIHGYSYLISLDIVVGYRKLRSFQGTQVNLVKETRETIETSETRYHVSIGDTESLGSSCRISPKTSNHAENTLILVVPPNFPNITGDKVSLWLE